jgi:RNA polymerase sigma factor (sigma-70 family)
MSEDAELLRRYADEHSEAAIAELVRRHVDLVYSAALRLVRGDAHRAQDVTQQVFTELARQSKRLIRHPAPVGWLYTTTRQCAWHVIRTEQRRSAREQEATAMNELLRESAPEADWNQLSPMLEEAMHELGEKDRHAVLLRFFQNKSLKEVGRALDLNENAARMRVERALEKLRAALKHRGIETGAALATVISANAVQVAPANLAATLTAASIASAGTGTLTLLKIMTATQLKIGISALAVAGATAALVIQHQAQQELRSQNESLAQQMAQLQADNLALSNQVAGSGESRSLPGDQLNELLKLRGEVGVLRQQTNQLARVRAENQRLQMAQRAQFQAVTADAQEQERQAAFVKMNNAKQGMLAFVMFAADNGNQFPTNFDQASFYLKDDLMQQIETNFEIAYSGSMTNVAAPATTIVLKEKQAWQSGDGKWLKTYGFADGHAELHTEPNGNFDDWERQRTIAPPDQ